MNKNVLNNKADRSRMYRKIKRWRIFFFQQSCVYDYVLASKEQKF